MKDEDNSGYGRYFSFLNLFVFSMLLLVMGGNYVIMFMGWEGVGLCSYLLIGFWFKNNSFNNAAKKAFIMNRIGDFGFILGIFWLINAFGTTSYHNLFDAANRNSFYNNRKKFYCSHRNKLIAFCRRNGQKRSNSSIYLAARCNGRPHTGFSAYTCSNNGYGRNLYDCQKQYYLFNGAIYHDVCCHHRIDHCNICGCNCIKTK